MFFCFFVCFVWDCKRSNALRLPLIPSPSQRKLALLLTTLSFSLFLLVFFLRLYKTEKKRTGLVLFLIKLYVVA